MSVLPAHVLTVVLALMESTDTSVNAPQDSVGSTVNRVSIPRNNLSPFGKKNA